jgi:hypothetical protein
MESEIKRSRCEGREANTGPDRGGANISMLDHVLSYSLVLCGHLKHLVAYIVIHVRV